MPNPYDVVEQFESALAEYIGAKYAVTTTSCTMALLLACRWQYESNVKYSSNPNHLIVTIPSRTYISVPQSIIHAGFTPNFVDKKWHGGYCLEPLPVWDYARWFTGGLHSPNNFSCFSFHWSKTLAIGQGGAILHDDDEADVWLRKARFDGRTAGVAPKDDDIDVLGYHAYMSPRDAAEGLSRLALLPKMNPPIPNDDYPDLSEMEIFK